MAALDAWQDEHFSPAQQTNEAVSGLLADPDLDGRVNAFEFSCVTDPWTVTPGSPGVYSVVAQGLSRPQPLSRKGTFRFAFIRRQRNVCC